MEEGEFKNWIEKVQARLMSSSVDAPQQLQAVFESLIAKKQSLCEVLQAWNSRWDWASGASSLLLRNGLCHDVFSLSVLVIMDVLVYSQFVEAFVFCHHYYPHIFSYFKKYIC